MAGGVLEERSLVLPYFPNGDMPPPEPPGQARATRTLALGTLAVTAVYLTWRLLGGTVGLGAWWVSIPLFLVELHNFVGLSLFTGSLWRIEPPAPPAGRPLPALRVAVLIPTYNEPREVLLPAIAAAVALRHPHETWVLDDGRRPEVRALAEQLGAHYLARPTNEHAKAGNLNHALQHVDADVLAVLDADYVALPGFLERTLPYFADPRVAVVQTPQDFYNLDSFEHERIDGDRFFSEEGVFYRVIGPGKNQWGAAFWCGTCALVRKEALLSVGGVATESITEDIHTTIRLHRRGWTTVYHNEVLARGLAPGDAAQYLKQRHRWAVGAMQVLRLEHPLLGRGLTLGQRLGYASTLLGWFDSWRTLTYLLLPPLVIWTDSTPIRAHGEIVAPAIAVVVISQLLAQRRLARGYYSPVLSLTFDILRMPAVLPATMALLAPRRRWRFEVTAKGRVGAARERVRTPGLLVALLAANTGGLAWLLATATGLTPMRFDEPFAAWGAGAFAVLNLAMLAAALRRVRSTRFAGERRGSVRFPVYLSAAVDGTHCEVLDLSVTGAQVYLPAEAVAPGESVPLAITGPDGVVALRARIRRRIARESGATELGLEFDEGQERELARVALWLFTHTASQTPPAARGPGSRRRALAA